MKQRQHHASSWIRGSLAVRVFRFSHVVAFPVPILVVRPNLMMLLLTFLFRCFSFLCCPEPQLLFSSRSCRSSTMSADGVALLIQLTFPTISSWMLLFPPGSSCCTFRSSSCSFRSCLSRVPSHPVFLFPFLLIPSFSQLTVLLVLFIKPFCSKKNALECSRGACFLFFFRKYFSGFRCKNALFGTGELGV